MGVQEEYKDDSIDSWMEVVLVYNSALKEIGTKLEILNDEFQQVHQYNPIEQTNNLKSVNHVKRSKPRSD